MIDDYIARVQAAILAGQITAAQVQSVANRFEQAGDKLYADALRTAVAGLVSAGHVPEPELANNTEGGP